MPKLKVKVGHILRDKETRKLYVVIDIDSIAERRMKRLDYGIFDYLKSWFGMKDIFISVIPKEDFDIFNGYVVSDDMIKNYTYIFIEDLKKFEIMNPGMPFKIKVTKWYHNIFQFGNEAHVEYKKGE